MNKNEILRQLDLMEITIETAIQCLRLQNGLRADGVLDVLTDLRVRVQKIEEEMAD